MKEQCFLWFHDWGKWEEYLVTLKEKFVWQEKWDDVTRMRQKRKCKRCGLTQYNDIPF